jgi:hypothetical protein
MRSMILAAAAGASLALASSYASAMPAQTVAGVAPTPSLTLVSDGCGRFAHRAPDGVCIANRGYYARPYYRPYYYARPWARCGIRVGPIGIGGPC